MYQLNINTEQISIQKKKEILDENKKKKGLFYNM